MPPLPGEERILTVFADIHYYFTAPTPSPLHHRFDKGSYLYIYYDASRRKARIEVANNPGTPEQDAFNGALDFVHLRHSTRFPTLCTLTVDGPSSASNPVTPQSPTASLYEWRLPSKDPRDANQDLLRLHTLDIYFWTLDDANQFLDSFGLILHRAQIETDRQPLPSHPDNTISPVVQQLENVAITDPAYRNGQTRNSRSEPLPNSISNPQRLSGTNSDLPSPPQFAGPPTSVQTVTTGNQSPAEEQKEPATFTPLPYNPAAPAAPEPIKHREKTPPPVDGTDGTGLAAAAAADHGVPYTPPSQVTPGLTGFAPPPGSTFASGYASPPSSAGLTSSASFPSHSSIQTPPGVPSYSASFLAGAGGQLGQQPGSMSFAPPPQDPNAHFYGQPPPQQQFYGSPPQPQLQRHSTAPSIGGYSNYTYDQAQKQHPGVSEYDIHSQAYRPTETEANSHLQKYAQKAMKKPGQRPRKLEDGAARVESSVNKFLRKLEKKL